MSIFTDPRDDYLFQETGQRCGECGLATTERGELCINCRTPTGTDPCAAGLRSLPYDTMQHMIIIRRKNRD